MPDKFKQLLDKAMAKFYAMTPEQQAEHRRVQIEGIVKAEMAWPKPKYHYENGIKIYDSYEDYLND